MRSATFRGPADIQAMQSAFAALQDVVPDDVDPVKRRSSC